MARKTTKQEVAEYLLKCNGWEFELTVPGFENKLVLVAAADETTARTILKHYYPAAVATLTYKYNTIHHDTRSTTGSGLPMGTQHIPNNTRHIVRRSE